MKGLDSLSECNVPKKEKWHENKYLQIHLKNGTEERTIIRIGEKDHNVQNHVHILQKFQEELDELLGPDNSIEVKAVGGGRIVSETETIRLWGFSADYGAEDERKRSAEIVKRTFPSKTVVAQIGDMPNCQLITIN